MPEPDVTDELAQLIDDLRTAATMLDDETHRYVERFIPCPAGCEFEGAADPVRVKGPDPCPESCFYGTIEDEEARHLDPMVERLRRHADVLSAGLPEGHPHKTGVGTTPAV